MADDRHFVGGDYYRICDRTGYKVRARKTKREWTGNIVREQSFELRQPQDFVRGRKDPQTVPLPRPRQTDIFVDPQFRITNNMFNGQLEDHIRITMDGNPRIWHERL